MKTLIHLSHTDLDGYGCQWVSEKYVGDKYDEVIYFNSNYGEELDINVTDVITTVEEIVNEDESGEIDVIITDLNLNDYHVQQLDNLRHQYQNVSVNLYDHHPTDIEHLPEWYNLDRSMSATMLYFKTVTEWDNLNESHAVLVDMINAADIFDKSVPTLFESGRIINYHTMMQNDVNRYVDGGGFNKYVFSMLDRISGVLTYGLLKGKESTTDFDLDVARFKYEFFGGKPMYQALAEYNAKLIAENNPHIWVVDNDEPKKVLLGYDVANASDVADYVWKLSDEYDACIFLSKNGGIAFRSREDGLARVMALSIGGGGHPRASGGYLEGVKNAKTPKEAYSALAKAL